MATAVAENVRIVRYTDADGQTYEVEVTPEVAAVLARDPEHRPAREVAFTDLFRPRPRARAIDLARVDWLSHELRLYYRGLRSRADISPWEGPRLKFSLLLGSGRQWYGPPRRKGPCPICRGLPLEEYVYCIGCDRCGRELDVGTVPREVQRRCERAERERRAGTDGRLKGGKGR